MAAAGMLSYKIPCHTKLTTDETNAQLKSSTYLIHALTWYKPCILLIDY